MGRPKSKSLGPKFKIGQIKSGYQIIHDDYICPVHAKNEYSSYRYWLCKCLNCKRTKLINETNLRDHKNKYCEYCLPYDKDKNPHWTGYKGLPGKYWAQVKYGAYSRKIEFKITIKQAWNLFEKQNGQCALTGKKLEFWSRNCKNNLSYASLDRIDSSKGYTINNVQWVQAKVNLMKRSLSNKEFLQIVKDIQVYKNL